jgi:hypothetical protein
MSFCGRILMKPHYEDHYETGDASGQQDRSDQPEAATQLSTFDDYPSRTSTPKL